MTVEGIVFDSGDTLFRPIGGSWMPCHPFSAEVAPTYGIDLDAAPHSVAAADAWDGLVADMARCIATHDAEVTMWSEYYRRLLAPHGLAGNEGMVSRLALEHANATNVEPYEDTVTTIQALAATGMPLGVVSNAWPSLRAAYHCHCILDCFTVVVISSEHRVWKPDEAIFDLAVTEMGVPSDRLAYVDDFPDYVAVAQRLGMTGVVLDRSGQYDPGSVGAPLAHDLAEVLTHLGITRPPASPPILASA